MSHEFESGVMFGKSAWHGLGTTLPSDDPRRKDVEGAMIAAKMSWHVSKVPVATRRTEDIPEAYRGRIIDDMFAVCRDVEPHYLGMVGTQHETLQNVDLFRWYQPFLDSGQAEFETAGSLRGGRVVWVLARMCEEDYRIADRDHVRPYILLSSSHDGSMATRAGFSPVRVECANLLRMAHEEGNLLRVKHTQSQHEALKLVRETMDLVRGEFRATSDQYRRLAEFQINRQDLADYVRQVMEVKPRTELAWSDIPTRTKNKMELMIDRALTGVGQDGRELTAWTAYQGVTQFVTHDRNKDNDKRLHSAWFGSGGVMNKRALDLAIKLAV